MKKNACGKCGKDPALGLSTIDGVRYCQGVRRPSCYDEKWLLDLGFGTDAELEELGLAVKQTPGSQT